MLAARCRQADAAVRTGPDHCIHPEIMVKHMKANGLFRNITTGENHG
jgi:hypothetical protein